MKTYIIILNLNTPVINQHKVFQKIGECDGYAQITPSAYVVASRSSAAQIRDNLSKVLLEKDLLFVGRAPAPAAWKGLSDEVGKWLLANLPK